MSRVCCHAILLGLCEKMLIFDDVIKNSDDVIKFIIVQNVFYSLTNIVSFRKVSLNFIQNYGKLLGIVFIELSPNRLRYL